MEYVLIPFQKYLLMEDSQHIVYKVLEMPSRLTATSGVLASAGMPATMHAEA